jgi:two-component system NtrC family sensor kinase
VRISRTALSCLFHLKGYGEAGFNITLEESLDPSAGELHVYPQEITRVLLNLISNGFYATMARKAQLTAEAYEPTISASTQNLGDRVEIRIRDNGTLRQLRKGCSTRSSRPSRRVKVPGSVFR